MKKILTLLFILFSINIFAQNGKFIGRFKTVPVPSDQSVNFNIMSGNYSTAFRIDAKTGELFINNQTAIDAHGWNYTLIIRARFSKKINGTTVILGDSISNFVIDSRYSKIVNEIKINNLPANQAINFHIMSGNPSTAFTIDPVKGAVFINNQTAIDSYGWRYTLIVRLRYSLKGTNTILADTMRTIRILNMTKGKFIGIVNAYDQDVGQKLKYKFISGNYSTAFRIDANTGNIFVNNVDPINQLMKTGDKYVLNTRVSDNGNPQLSSSGNVTILLFGGIVRQDVFNCRYP